jgi:hypothetical protein
MPGAVNANYSYGDATPAGTGRKEVRRCAARAAGSGGSSLIIPILTPAVPDIVRLANYSGTIYFVDPDPGNMEVIHNDHNVFCA